MPCTPAIHRCLSAAILFTALPAVASERSGLVEEFESEVAPILEAFCTDCHSADYSEGGVELDALDPDVVNGDDAQQWLRLLEMIRRGQMPPEDADRPSDAERRIVLNWITAALDLAREAHRGEAPTLRRMTKAQYRNTLQDLLKLPIDFTRALPDDAKSRHGFSNSVSAQQTSSLHLEMYEAIAREALGKAIVEGERPPSIRYRVTLGEGVGAGGDAAMFKGYQCLPIDREDVRVELLDRDGSPLEDESPVLHGKAADARREIGVGMRGAVRIRRDDEDALDQDDPDAKFEERFRVVESGVELLSAFPRREVSPASWQGPSPNLKMLLRRVTPTSGPFAVRITASRAGEGPDVPYAQAVVGSRTDDGMEYRELGEPTRVVAVGAENAVTLEHHDYFENFPTPSMRAPADAEAAKENGVQSGILVVGVWNDHMVKRANLEGSELIIHSVELEAPYFPVWPPESHRAIFFDEPSRERDVDAYTRRVIERFITRAFRRPVRAEEVDRYFDFWSAIHDDFDSYEVSVRETLVAVLCSPEFFFIDRPLAGESDSLLATKLAYFLWDSPPDRALLDAASSGELRAELPRIIGEMLRDAKARRFVERFATEWLRMDRHASMRIDAKRRPAYTRFVKADMHEETVHYLQHALTENLSARALVASNFVLVNQNLAEFYGIEGVHGSEFRRVAVGDDSLRGGLLTQGSFLVGHSDGREPHPIKRAVWLKERILGETPPPPPPNVPELNADTPGFEKLTLKEQLRLHRDKDSCRDCHNKIDPYGIVFEQFDATGRFRMKAKGRPVDARSVLPDETELDGVAEMQAYILQDRYEDYLRSLCTHLFAYATGREVTYVERPQIDRLVEKGLRDDRLASLIVEVIRSEAFLGAPPTSPVKHTEQ